MRILVTGSREWTDTEVIRQALAEHAKLTEKTVVIDGACPRGADKIAHWFAVAWGWRTERYLADWETHGKRAGFIRNAEMVAAGADVCLAFIKDGSKGATHCANLAENAGIPVRRFTA